MNRPKLQQALREVLLYKGAISAKAAISTLKISQPTFARVANSMGDEVITMGKGRATKYALRREVRNLGSRIPIYIVSSLDAPRELVEHLADLIPIKPKGYFVNPFSEHVRAGVFEDLPYWLNDLRPAGFLGSLIVKKHPELGYPNDIRLWSNEDCLHYLATLAWDPIGNVIVGERALELFSKYSRNPPLIVKDSERPIRYPQLADEVLRLGAAGSSAGGEQPKFLTIKSSKHSNSLTSVLVKFSPEGLGPVARRRRELLVCEHLSLRTLKAAGIDAAKSELIESSPRLFLEIERFDRLGVSSRRGVISLLTLDLQHTGSLGSWREIARALFDRKIISQDWCNEILRRYYFGMYIGNTDMHAGNISFYSQGETLQGLAPVYDMLPMMFAPVHEQLVPMHCKPPTLFANDVGIWNSVAEAARIFWDQVIHDPRIGIELKTDAKKWRHLLKQS